MKPIKITVVNQKGGVGKTTTVLTLGRCFADRGLKVLMIDTDPQGNLWTVLSGQSCFDNGKVKPEYWIHQLFAEDPVALTRMVVPVRDNIFAVFSDRRMFIAESRLAAMTARELVLSHLFQFAEPDYDVILFDVAPSISQIQSCAIAYTGNILIPVGMDNLSIQGATSAIQTMDVLNRMLKLDCHCLGFLPTMIDMRLSATEAVMHALAGISAERNISVLPGIRTDQAINKSLRSGKFLQDFDPKSRALEDYQRSCSLLLEVFNQNGKPATQGS